MCLNSLFYRRQQFIGFRRFLEKSFCSFSYGIYSQLNITVGRKEDNRQRNVFFSSLNPELPILTVPAF